MIAVISFFLIDSKTYYQCRMVILYNELILSEFCQPAILSLTICRQLRTDLPLLQAACIRSLQFGSPSMSRICFPEMQRASL